MELGAHKLNKILKDSTCIGFISQRKSPGVMRKIIKYNEIVFVTRKTNYWRSPQVAMDELKCSGGG
jgi:hypothetical protein